MVEPSWEPEHLNRVPARINNSSLQPFFIRKSSVYPQLVFERDIYNPASQFLRGKIFRHSENSSLWEKKFAEQTVCFEYSSRHVKKFFEHLGVFVFGFDESFR